MYSPFRNNKMAYVLTIYIILFPDKGKKLTRKWIQLCDGYLDVTHFTRTIQRWNIFMWSADRIAKLLRKYFGWRSFPFAIALLHVKKQLHTRTSTLLKLMLQFTYLVKLWKHHVTGWIWQSIFVVGNVFSLIWR